MLHTLELQNIRSYTNGLFQFSESVNIIVGPNASGKTNLLEAIHMLCTGSAFKSDDTLMVNRDSDWARIDASIDDTTRTMKLQKQPLKKIFVIDDLEKKRLVGKNLLPVVLFEPGHMLLLSSEPERRRSYIDGVLKQTEPFFNENLTKYKRALAQRNRLLKQDNISLEHMFVWDLQLCELAGSLVEYRQNYIAHVNSELTNRYRSVSGNNETLQLQYESKLAVESYADSLAKKLKDSFDLDRLRGYTGAGPHRDDIQILLDDNDARSNASRGETRSIVLALKIAELERITEKLERKPLLLLDDVFSELDGKRRRTLAKTLQQYQTFITTTDADVVMEHFTDCNIIPTSKT
jgi:DNA replication and repair protein RecF